VKDTVLAQLLMSVGGGKKPCETEGVLEGVGEAVEEVEDPWDAVGVAVGGGTQAVMATLPP
jgi:hypothetical protein